MLRWRLAAFGLLTALAACSGPGTTGTSSVAGTAITSPWASAAAPMGVPAGFPVMPGSAPVEPTPDEPGLLGRWMSPVIGPQVYRYFVDALPAAGFKIEERLPGGAVAVIRVTTASGEGLDLVLTAAGDGTRIDLREPDTSAR